MGKKGRWFGLSRVSTYSKAPPLDTFHGYLAIQLYFMLSWDMVRDPSQAGWSLWPPKFYSGHQKALGCC